ncbi:hypothetical protein PTSG_01605 [Salpingoeca rosetta]|uniref:Uncharacterized protein n=1 Tax=Salpingoeca rosetta (strain ATCC 50818 / BSB-021) TaxID=946362 RepID=F2TYF3_SALR5|nr:uncharacterized protein PTSG_01605 [Salpingoeca rosetta]EGD78627.1 hypothetical protein PTSG_01605 [Salpingoeca rosetta]|eukprot:XP_004997585.1 hypothetical protein PTSG_01605 [Salpingoeca rosetta]
MAMARRVLPAGVGVFTVVLVAVMVVGTTTPVLGMPMPKKTTLGNSAFFVEDLAEFLHWDTTTPTTPRNVRTKLDAWLASFQTNMQGYTESAAHAFEWIPQYIGEANPQNSLTWSTQCFGHNTLHVTDLSSDGAKLHVNFSEPISSSSCEEDFYMVATIQGLFFIQVHAAKAEVHQWPGNINSQELSWINRNGFRVFRFNGTLDSTLRSLGATASLFLPAELTREVWEKVGARNVEFLRAKAFYELPERNTTDVIPDESDIHDGDFFGVLRLDGLDPMLAWAMGAHTGHTTVALRFDGELYICESTTVSSYWPTDGIQKTPYRQVLIGLVEKVDADIAAMMWTMALNKRLGTANLTVAEVYDTAASRNISFTTLFAMPEQDSWQYVDGYSMVCDVLVCETWKAAGLMGALTDKIQCTEFTNWDAYTLNIFDSTTPRPAACKAADPDLPFCQILGKYRMDLPFYNSRPMVPHMAERCPRGPPPHFPKPSGC